METLKVFLFFLLHILTFSLLPTPNIVSSKTTQADTLLRWKNSISNPAVLDSWKPNNVSNLCSWIGVGCDVDGSISWLSLDFTKLGGTLDQLNFSSLLTLSIIDLSGNNFRGLIPYQIGDLKNLTSLDLSFNSFIGEIPKSLFTNSCKLEYLDLRFNHFQGDFQLILTKLTKCNLTGLLLNNIFGSIPDIFGLIPNLEILELTASQGNIPSSIGKLRNLQTLDLKMGSLLDYEIPFELGLCTNLSYLSLSGNSLTGSLPLSLSNLTSLSFLSVHDTNLSGQILPSFMTNWTHLIWLRIENNYFTGEIPFEIGLLTNLTYLYLSGNRFFGYISHGIGSLQNLKAIDFSDNLFFGKIPPTFENLTDLRYLNVSFNYLTSMISIGNLKSIVILDLSMNQVNGQLHKIFSKLGSKLAYLNLKQNRFHGFIPEIFPKRCQLVILNLNGNQLNGTLPKTLVNRRKLEVLDIGSNEISGPFPFWMGTLLNLRVLVLKSNRFHAIIPNSKVKHPFSKLQILDLSHNEFTGVLPVEFLNNFKAMINVSENETARSVLLHEIIDALGIWMDLSETILGDRSTVLLKGFEYELRSIRRAFTSIDLSNNKFQGDIPSSLGKITDLHALNLACNSFTGHIPPIENLTSLESLDLRSNQLVGEIPWQLTKLTFLSFLNISYNHFVGPIPQQGQLLTFDNSSYIGNPELRGLPLTKTCGNGEPKLQLPVPMTENDDDFNILDGFTWQIVAMGYGGGILFGFVIGYFIFKYEKPRWLIRFVYQVYKIKMR
ncbi:receptor 12 [Olea europaea subsp. europaea]|uniref:Receptor 12 n=1 Tax=Olea europaea subsp. europaea TaxID=158383 RepID=A0A8S0SNI0_OLEEU|nr:receptor 12 [Olea europaea subsp. europaea]